MLMLAVMTMTMMQTMSARMRVIESGGRVVAVADNDHVQSSGPPREAEYADHGGQLGFGGLALDSGPWSKFLV
jgi:hypothetical protein